MKRRFMLAGALVALTPLSPVSSAHADPVAKEPTYVDVLTVRIDKSDPGVGYVRARYRCDESFDHLWVSVKQNSGGTADPALLGPDQGFGGGASTWLQAHPVDGFTCDERTHVGTFQV